MNEKLEVAFFEAKGSFRILSLVFVVFRTDGEEFPVLLVEIIVSDAAQEKLSALTLKHYSALSNRSHIEHVLHHFVDTLVEFL